MSSLFMKALLPAHPKPYKGDSLLSVLSQLRNKTFEILNNPMNDWETEQDFRRTCLLYANYASDPLISQAYQEYVNAYKQITSLFFINKINERSHLFIYDTESGKEEIKFLEGIEELDKYTSIAKLPNGDLFCFGNGVWSACALIIDRNFKVRILPSETPRGSSSIIYFNRSFYCFGGLDLCYYSMDESSRFDFDENRWIKLAPMSIPDYSCYCTVFNGNILIFGYESSKLLLYSVDIDSFSIIPYKFSAFRAMVLISAEERLFLVGPDDRYNTIYESEVGDEYAWKEIMRSLTMYEKCQVHWSYNKGGVYMSFAIRDENNENLSEYFKFDLDQKTLSCAYYNDSLA